MCIWFVFVGFGGHLVELRCIWTHYQHQAMDFFYQSYIIKQPPAFPHPLPSAKPDLCFCGGPPGKDRGLGGVEELQFRVGLLLAAVAAARRAVPGLFERQGILVVFTHPAVEANKIWRCLSVPGSYEVCR